MRNLGAKLWRAPATAAAGLVRGYQRWISPLTGAHCRFYPSCSSYAIGALKTHGLVKGLVLTGWRLARCQPFNRGGVDHVPPVGRWRGEQVAESRGGAGRTVEADYAGI